MKSTRGPGAGTHRSQCVNSVQGEVPDIAGPAFVATVPRSLIPLVDTMKALKIDAQAYKYNFNDAADDIRAVMFNMSAVDSTCDLKCRLEQVGLGKLRDALYFTRALLHAEPLCALLQIHSSMCTRDKAVSPSFVKKSSISERKVANRTIHRDTSNSLTRAKDTTGHFFKSVRK